MRKLFTFIAALAVGAFSYTAHAQYTNLTLHVGDSVEIADENGDLKWWLVGQNIIDNPSFETNPADNGGNIVGWTVGTYAQMTTGNFNWVAEGGHDGGAYINAKSHNGAAGAGSVGSRWQVEPGKKYYLSFWLMNQTAQNQYIPVVSLTVNRSSAGGQNEYRNQAFAGEEEVEAGKNRMLLGKNGEDPSDDSYGYSNFEAVDTWTRTAIFFDSEDYTYLQFNARWLKETKNGNKVDASFDDFYLCQLYDPETTSRQELMLIAAGALIEKAETKVDQLMDYPGMQSEVYDEIMEGENLGKTSSEEDIEEWMNRMTSLLEATDAAVLAAAQIDALLTEGERLITTTNYPGLKDFQKTFVEVSEELDGGMMKSSEYPEAYQKLVQAVNDYRFSQNATAENPADYTFLIQHPWFLNSSAEPTVTDYGYEFPNIAEYTEGSVPSDGNSGGWYIGESGGDQRLNFKAGRPCWNAWGLSFGSRTVGQDLTSLPNGYYQVSADVITQAGCITDQHVFANSSIASAESPVLGEEAFMDESDPASSVWGTLTTETVMVSDGKLTIGVTGTGDTEHTPNEFGGSNTDYRRGWFCTTNFRLFYLGSLDDNAVKEGYEAKINEMKELAATMKLAADKAAFLAKIEKFSGATTTGEINDFLDSLAVAQKVAEASIIEYNSVMAGSLKNLTDNISEGTYTGDVAKVAQKPIDIMNAYLESAQATYTETPAKTTILRAYRDSYLPALSNAVATEVTDETGKAALEATIAEQVEYLTNISGFPTTEKLDELKEQLEKAVIIAKAADLSQEDGTDYTGVLVNPEVASNATGWIVKRVNGNTDTASGQAYDGSSSAYLDSWNGTTGALRYTAKQTLSNIPNGTYELTAMMRASGNHGVEGVYLFAQAGEDTPVFAGAHSTLTNLTQITGETAADGSDSLFYATDIYGPIWEKVNTESDEGATLEEGTIEADIWNANGGKGRGWQYVSLQVEVTDHELTVGVSNDSVFTVYGFVDDEAFNAAVEESEGAVDPAPALAGFVDKDGNPTVPFSGTWFSADNFKLVLLKAGDNEGWNPANGVKVIEVADKKTTGAVYNLNGQKVRNNGLEGLARGIYIVNGKKVLVK